MSQQATKPFLHHKRVPCLSFAHFWAFGGLCWAISIRLFPRDVEKQKVPLYHRFRSYFYLFLLNKVKNWYAKSCFSYLIRWILQEKKYLCTQISVSWKEIEKFAKQISVYKSPNIILFALSTTDVSKEARYICVVASESCPIPSLITDNGTFFALAALAHEWRATYMVSGLWCFSIVESSFRR